MSLEKNFKTQLLYGLILSLIFGITITTFFSIKSLISSSKWVAHSQFVIGRGDQLEGFIYKARYANRGFFLTGEEFYLKQYENNKAESLKFLAATEQLVSDDLVQVALLQEVNNLTEQLYENAAVAISYKKNLTTNVSVIRQHAIQQTAAFTEIKTALHQLQSALNQQKNDKAEILVVNIRIELLNCEALQKDFLFTGEEKFLDLYDTHLQELEAKLNLLEDYFAQEFAKENDFIRQANTIKMEIKKNKNLLLRRELKDYATEILTFAGNASEAIREVMVKNRGLMESIEEKIDEFTENEEALSAIRNQNMYFTGLLTQGVSIFGNLIIILLGIVAVISFNRQDWLKSGYTALNEKMKGEQDIALLTKNVLSFISSYLKVKVGLFYLLKKSAPADQKPNLQLISSYAYTPPANVPDKFLVGEGLIGEVALERKPVFHSSNESTSIIQSTLVQSQSRHVLFMPVLFENILIGVFELSVPRRLRKIEFQFLEGVTQNIGVALNTSVARSKMNELLAYSQQQETALLLQRNELQQSNEELQSQSEELQSQQEEMRQYNEELEQRTHELEQQREQIREKNQVLEKTKIEVETKARELETASKYKSEFLANMSHELRTPLNSILVLAQVLGRNKDGNLTDKQIEQANTIYQSGTDLLTLINDVLDLSKVEAGKMDIHLEDMPLTDLVENVKRKFAHIAEGKGLDFQATLADNLPLTIHTDAQRLNQIVTNLLSNAFKFTSEGTVQLFIEYPLAEENALEGLNPEQIVAIRVIDSGIGIPKNKQQLIFEAFQQADGTTSRHYGGTGLGLSISREFSKLLGGKLSLTSEEGKGSTFTLYLPIVYSLVENLKNTVSIVEKSTPTLKTEQLDTSILVGKKVLIVDDDPRNSFALTLILDDIGMTTLSCNSGQEAISFLERNPDMDAVLMDIMMPGMNGYETITKIRKLPLFKNLPIIAITAKAMAGDRKKCIEAGANDYVTKPVSDEKLASLLQVWLS